MTPPDPPAAAETPSSQAPPGAGRSLQTQIGGVTGEGEKLCPTCEARYPHNFRACPRDGTALVEIDDTIGTTLSGTYFVRRMLGEGAMGRVYEARHTRIPGKRFAIKMLHPEYVFEPQVLARFAREAEAAATIDHPNVVGVVDVDRTPDGRPFLVSEYLVGKDFGDYLLEVRTMPIATAVHVTRQVADALAAAHARGIIHRDMKPENVFLTGDLTAPVAKVLDFGISRLERRSGKQLTEAGSVLGTPSFMPPEQARGDRVDHRADVYSVGAILYTAITGRRPFDRDSPAATLLAVLAEEPPRPRSFDPAIPEALELVILRAMARDPDQRYATMEELASALARFDTRDLGPPSSGAPSAGRTAATLRDTAQDRLLAGARPALLTLVTAVFVWAGAAIASALAALVRAVHNEGDSMSAAETALVFAVLVAGLGPPLFLAIRGIRARLWNQPLRSAAIVQQAAPAAICAIATYGLASAIVRGFETTLVPHPSRPPSAWDVVLLVLGVAGAGLPMLVRWAQERRPPG